MEKMIKNDTSLDKKRLSVIKQILLKVNSLLYFINNYQGKDNYYSNLSNIDFDKAIHISNMDVKQRDKYFLLKDLLRTNNGTKFKNLVQNDDSFFDLLILFYRDLILNINILWYNNHKRESDTMKDKKTIISRLETLITEYVGANGIDSNV